MRQRLRRVSSRKIVCVPRLFWYVAKISVTMQAQAIVINSKNANACTGEVGTEERTADGLDWWEKHSV